MQSERYNKYLEFIGFSNYQIEMLDGAHFLHIVAYDEFEKIYTLKTKTEGGYILLREAKNNEEAYWKKRL
jgi:hypothetical protein